jgi:glutamate racemase
MPQFNPIGVFDSGVGGLTVLKSLRELFTAENFIYLGDTANVPYGGKSKETISRLVNSHINFFKEQKVKALVLACNTASTLIGELQDPGFPILGVIAPGARAASKATQNKRVGVIATPATIKSGVYTKELLSCDPSINVIPVAGTMLVPLAEDGWIEDPITNLIVQRYCNVFLKQEIDTLILGCTHYPILKSSFTRIFGNSFNLIESGPAVCADVIKLISSEAIPANPISKPGTLVVTITDSSQEQFTRTMSRILIGQDFPEVIVL